MKILSVIKNVKYKFLAIEFYAQKLFSYIISSVCYLNIFIFLIEIINCVQLHNSYLRYSYKNYNYKTHYLLILKNF